MVVVSALCSHLGRAKSKVPKPMCKLLRSKRGLGQLPNWEIQKAKSCHSVVIGCACAKAELQLARDH